MVRYYGRARQITGTVFTNQPGLKQAGCPGTVGKRGTIVRFLGRRVNCNLKTCGLPMSGLRCKYGVRQAIGSMNWKDVDRSNNPAIPNYCHQVVNKWNGVHCRWPQPKNRQLAGGVGNIWTPRRNHCEKTCSLGWEEKYMNAHPGGLRSSDVSQWTSTTYPMVTPRAGHGIVALATKIPAGYPGAGELVQWLYAIGGYTQYGSTSDVLGTVESYGIGVETSSGEPGWTLGRSSAWPWWSGGTRAVTGLIPRWGHGVAATGAPDDSGLIWAIGGGRNFGTTNATTNSVQYLENSSLIWADAKPLPDVRGRFMPGVAVYENVVYVTGGRPRTGWPFYTSVVKMVSGTGTPATWPWVTTVPPMKTPRAAHGVAVTSDGKLWAAGGLSGASSTHVAMRSVEYLDIAGGGADLEHRRCRQARHRVRRRPPDVDSPSEFSARCHREPYCMRSGAKAAAGGPRPHRSCPTAWPVSNPSTRRWYPWYGNRSQV